MIDYQKIIIKDLEEMIKKNNIDKICPKEEIERVLVMFEMELVKKYNSIYNFINDIGDTNSNRKLYNCNLGNYLVSIFIDKDGSYKLKFGYRIETTKKYRGTFLLNEFNREAGFVYILKSEFGYKIGKSKDISKRNKIFEVKLPFPFKITHYIKTIHYHLLEKQLHEKYHDKLINGEWFELNENDINELRVYLRSKSLKLSDCNI